MAGDGLGSKPAAALQNAVVSRVVTNIACENNMRLSRSGDGGPCSKTTNTDGMFRYAIMLTISSVYIVLSRVTLVLDCG